MKTNEKFDGIITFGIDCDEVLRALLDNMVALYNEEFDDNINKDDIKDFNVDVSFPKIKEVTGGTASDWFFQKNGFRLFACSPALPRVKEAIDKLRRYGQVIIVTYQKSFKNKMDTLMWLNEHGIEYDGICFLKNKTLLHTDWLIDDNDWNLVGCNAENAVLITAPYNKDLNVHELKDKTNCDSIYRFESLEEFADWYETGK
jgi:5'(3')-deoxyribonucleotidase